MEDDPKIIYSGHCTRFVRDGVAVDLQIYRLEDTDWSLEVVNSANTSIVWDDLFKTDDEAFAEFMRTVNEEGMIAFAEKEVELRIVH
jgi:hypothetical protein